MAAPDGTQILFTRTGPDGWPADFLTTGEASGDGAGVRRGGWSPGVPEPQYVALATDDLVATAAALRAAGAPLRALPENYADDLDARFDLDPELLAAIREHGLMYEEDDRGGHLHLATEVQGDRVFVEFVQRLGGYDGSGAADAPVRMAGHRRARAVSR